MMMKCKKQFIALFLAVSVIFCVGSESYIKVEALEWAVPTITAGEAIKWLLGLLGVTVAGGALANTDYEQLVENYNDFAEIKGQSAMDTGKFWADIIDGTLDQGSKAWTTFKEWVSSKLPTGVSDLTAGNVIVNDFPNVVVNDSYYKNYAFLKAFKRVDVNGNSFYYFLPDNASVSLVNNNGINYLNFTSSITVEPINNAINSSTSSVTLNASNGGFSVRVYDNVQYYFYNFAIPSGFANFHEWAFNSSEGVFESAYPNINDIALILSNAISDAIPDVIPLPWDQVAGTAEGINDKINELIDKVNEGVLSLEDYMVAIQAILGVIAFDTTNDLVIPSNPDLPDETIKDKINENVNNNGFVLTGLENFFPFCIPFDIYSFITILVAEPVAPVINWHIYNPVSKSDNIITLDFSVWEPIVILFRYIFDFLFIIGLAMIARSLIGGDD